MYLLAGHIARAGDVFQTLIGAEEADIRARALFGMAFVCSAREERPEALDYARQCLNLSQASVVPIREWLEKYEAGQAT